MSDHQGLYLLRYGERLKLLEITLYDGGNSVAALIGPVAEDIYNHFRTLTPAAIRDSFIDGVVIALRAASGAQGQHVFALTSPDDTCWGTVGAIHRPAPQ